MQTRSRWLLIMLIRPLFVCLFCCLSSVPFVSSLAAADGPASVLDPSRDHYDSQHRHRTGSVTLHQGDGRGGGDAIDRSKATRAQKGERTGRRRMQRLRQRHRQHGQEEQECECRLP